MAVTFDLLTSKSNHFILQPYATGPQLHRSCKFDEIVTSGFQDIVFTSF